MFFKHIFISSLFISICVYVQINTQYIPQLPLYYSSQPYYNVGSNILNDQVTTSQSLPQGGMQSTGYSNIQGVYEQTGNGVVPSIANGVSLNNNEIATVTTTTTTPSYMNVPQVYVNNNAGLIPSMSPLMINTNYMTVPSTVQVLPVRNYNPLGIGSFIVNNNVM
jgi:hypothetical protein